MKVRELVVRSRLPRHEAKRLVGAVLGVVVTRLDPDRELTGPQVSRVRELESRRLAGTPLQYLEGTAPFGPFELVVDDRVLVPRPETEQLWELAVAEAADPRVIVDIGTGSGALAVALARSFPAARVVATDVSAPALEVAELNVRRLGVEVQLRRGDLYDALCGSLARSVDLLVSNPPYVAAGDWDGLAVDVKREPRRALVAGPRGTELLERLVDGLDGWLSPRGVAIFEIGETQGAALQTRAAGAGWKAEVRFDYAGRERFLVLRR